MEASDGFDDFVQHVNPALSRFLRVSSRDFRFVRAQGCSLVTHENETFTDWVSGFGTLSFGHHPTFAEAALREALGCSAPHLYVEALNPFAGQLASALVRATGESFETRFFANCGSEAGESAPTTAAAATGRAKILCANGGFHGPTPGAPRRLAPGLYWGAVE